MSAVVNSSVPVLQEAAELSSLKPQLDELGVPLFAVVKEDIGTEVQNFRPYFKGQIFLDKMVGMLHSAVNQPLVAWFFLPHLGSRFNQSSCVTFV